jgi:hypothetical protein
MAFGYIVSATAAENRLSIKAHTDCGTQRFAEQSRFMSTRLASRTPPIGARNQL